MSFNDIKSELQQVLDSDVTLRKEFNELKRSLSDYRNQLILRDEDCKRLGVNIDVLNTKLTVMERDNTLYKSEITSFKELRANIKDQLVEKQAEIDARFEEINSLKAELDTIAARYETQIESVKEEAYNELAHVKQSYETQITDLRTGAHYKELGLKDEFENRLNEVTSSFADKELSMKFFTLKNKSLSENSNPDITIHLHTFGLDTLWSCPLISFVDSYVRSFCIIWLV